MGPQGVQGCNFRVKVITKTFGTQKNQKICSCTEALSLAPVVAKTLGLPEVLFLAVRHGLCDRLDLEASGFQESHLLFISHPCNAMNPCLDLLEPFVSVSGSSQTMPDQDLTCIHTSSRFFKHCQLPSVNSFIYSQYN